MLRFFCQPHYLTGALGGTYLNGLALLLTVKQLALPDLAALLRVRLEERTVLGDGGDRKRCVLVPAAHHGLSWLRVGYRVLQFRREVELFGGVARHAEVENRSGVMQDDLPLFQEFTRVLRERDLRDPELSKAAQSRSPGTFARRDARACSWPPLPRRRGSDHRAARHGAA